MKKKSKVISTVAVNTDVVRLPPATNEITVNYKGHTGPDIDVVTLPVVSKGTKIIVINNGENDLKIIGVETTVLKKGRSKTFKL